MNSLQDSQLKSTWFSALDNVTAKWSQKKHSQLLWGFWRRTCIERQHPSRWDSPFPSLKISPFGELKLHSFGFHQISQSVTTARHRHFSPYDKAEPVGQSQSLLTKTSLEARLWSPWLGVLIPSTSARLCGDRLSSCSIRLIATNVFGTRSSSERLWTLPLKQITPRPFYLASKTVLWELLMKKLSRANRI